MIGDDRKEIRCALLVTDAAWEDGALAEFLSRQGEMTIRRFQVKDHSELNAEVCRGRYHRVIFPNLDALLRLIWNDDAELDRWKAAGVEIMLVAPPKSADGCWRDSVEEVHASLTRWRRERCRRRVIAAVIFSALALAAMAVLLFLIPPAR